MRLWIIIFLAGLLAPACGTAYWAESADEDAAAVLGVKESAFERFRTKGLLRPDLGDEVAVTDREPDGDVSDVPNLVGLRESLQIATDRNRDYKRERESLYLSALSLLTVRNTFSYFFTGSLAALLTDTESTSHRNQNTFRLGVSKILPTGGVVTFDASAAIESGSAQLNPEGGGYTLQQNWTASLSQPLLRDAGYETSHEPLTQAERNVVYAVRDFELFRQDFTIDVTARFYQLIRRIRVIENAEKDLEAKEFLRKQSKAKYEVDLATQVDLLRAEREYLRAENGLIRDREEFQLDLDRFKILLGLPTSFPLEIRYEEPGYTKLDVRLNIAVEAALHNRVDLLTAKDQFEDSERRVRISVNQLLPDLDIDARYTRSSPITPFVNWTRLVDGAYAVGLTLELPFERVRERNAFRRAVIEKNRSHRSLTLTEDNVLLEVRGAIRRLYRAVASLDIRKREIEAAERESRAALIRFENAAASNRDVSDAQNAVLQAQNNYIADLVEYEVARIALLRAVGILFIDENGMWVEP